MNPSGALVLVLLTACAPGRQAAEDGANLIIPEEPSEADSVDLARQAAAAWNSRNERASLQRAIAIWEQLLAQSPGDPKLLAELSRAYYLMADAHHRLAGETGAMVAAFEHGVAAGERAMMAASPEFAARVQAGDKVEDAVTLIPVAGQAAIYWYASNLGKLAVAKGFTTTLFYKDRIHAVMQYVLELDETFFYGAPHRYFGAFFAKAPSFAGGDLEKAKSHFDRAIEIAPTYLGTKVLYAEYYATKREDRELFTRLLTEAAEAELGALPDLEPEQRLEQEKARRLLSEIDEIF